MCAARQPLPATPLVIPVSSSAAPGCCAVVGRWRDRRSLLDSADRLAGSLPSLKGFGRRRRPAPADPQLGGIHLEALPAVGRNRDTLRQIRDAARLAPAAAAPSDAGPCAGTGRPALPGPPEHQAQGSAVQSLVEASQLPAGKRWRGRLGPSLFMTAVEVAPPGQGLREHGESLGRHALRLLAMTAEQRARNDLRPSLGTEPAGAADRREAIRDHCREAAAATALVPCPKSAQPPTGHGWRGLTTAGRRSVRDSGAVMDEQYGSLGFFTATLTDATAATATREQVAEFQTRLLFLIRRRLVRLGLDPLVLLVAEMHPHRRALDGAPVVHWHGVVKVSPGPYQRWVFRKEDYNRCVLQAYRIAFGHPRGHVQRLQLLPQLTGAARYLAKYMSKGGSAVEGLEGTQRGRMVPRQWWAWTGELRALVVACRIRPPARFLRWCVRWRHQLVDLGEAITGEVQIGEDGPIVGCWFGWRSEAALDRALRAWIEAELGQVDRAMGGNGAPLGGEAWADADGVVRYGYGGDLPPSSDG